MKKRINIRKITAFILVLCISLCSLSASFAVHAYAAEESELSVYNGKICYTAEDGNVYLLECGDVYSMAHAGGQLPVSDYYYSDGFFFNNPEDANPHLATLSMNLHQASCMFNSDDAQDYSKSVTECFGRFADDLGFGNLWANPDMYTMPTTTSVGFGFAYKQLMDADGNDTGKTCIVIAIRGSGYQDEWVNNFIVGTSGNALGFESSSQKVFDALNTYIENNNLTEAALSGNLCFWLAGHSRGGCVANLTSAKIIDSYTRAEKTPATYFHIALQTATALILPMQRELPQKPMAIPRFTIIYLRTTLFQD